jgi:hypothetical protein
VYATELSKTDNDTRPFQRKEQRRWLKPPEGKLKLNCDASFSPNSCDGGWGYVIRDSDGDVVSAGLGRVEFLLNAFEAEVGCIHGVQAAVNAGISNLILETDATLVQQAISSGGYRESMAGSLLEELDSLVSANFNSSVCLAVPRDCNKVAHELAILGCACTEGFEPVLSSLPDHVNAIIADEQSAYE